MTARGVKLAAAAIASLLLVVAAVAAIAGYWLLSTESGAAWLWRRAQAAAPGELSAGDFRGSFTGEGVTVRALVYSDASLAVSASRARLAIDPGLFPPSLGIDIVAARDVVIRLRERKEPPEPAGRFSPENLALPLEVTLRALNLERLRILNESGEPLFALERAALSGRWQEAIVLSGLSLDSSLGTLRGSAALSLREPFDANASLEGSYPLRVGEDVVPLAFVAAVSGSLANLHVTLDGSDPDFVVEGRLTDLLDAPAWEVEARSPRLQWPLAGPDPAVSLAETFVESRGSAADYTLAGRGAVTAVPGETVRFSFAGRGDRGGIDIDRLVLDGALAAARAGGALSWQDGFRIRLEAEVQRFDPSALTGQWPADLPVSGGVSGAFRQGKLELDRLHAEVAATGQALDADGLIDLDAGVVDLDLRWRDLRWPVGGADWRFRSAAGDVAVSGRPDDWTLAGRVALRTPELPGGTFELSGNGSREEATLILENSEVLGGNVAGRLRYEHPAGGRWSADLSAVSIDTGALFAEWPGRVSADFTASGRIEPLELGVDIERVSGTLRGSPLAGSGGFRWAEGDLSVQDLTLASGESRLAANGSLEAENGLEFDLDLPSLGSLVRQAAGSLHAAGNVSLAGEFPRAELELEASRLAWRDWRVDGVTATATQGRAPLVVEVEGRGLVLGGLEAGRFGLELAAAPGRQRLEARATLDDREVELTLGGGFGDWRRPLETGWTGELEALALVISEELRFDLEAPSGVELAPERVALERACLEDGGAARICIAGTYEGANRFSASANLQAMPVNLVKQVMDTELQFTQTLEGSLALRRRPGRRMSANARIDIAPGQIHNPENPRMALRTRAGSFRLDLDDGQVLLARLNLPVADATAIDAEFAVEDVRRGQDSGIGGKIAVNVYDIGVLAALVPAVQGAEGHLKVDLALDGTVAQPAVAGEASLTDGSLTYAPLGLELRDIELTSRVTEGNRVDVQSSFRAGDGTGRLYSSTNGLGAVGDDLRLRLTGDNLTIIDLPQVNVVADMDVGVALAPERLTLNGDVRIPYARLSPRDITATRVSESEDVVIVAGPEGVTEAQADDPPPFAIGGKVELTLGDDVVVDFDAAQTRVSGSVSFGWNGPPMPVATGEYKVSGRFEAYGQLLEITEGSVRFAEVPADNPQLRIRAEREIFGNPRIRSAGVLVSGTAKDPEVEVYTSPATNEERALTLLVTGSDFDYEQGVGAVDVGTYIAPDLYLSYGIGLFDRENVISVRYDIARGFGIKATSGKSTEGVDLSYTFER